MKLACGDHAFPLLPHEHSLDVIRLLGVEGVDLALMGDRSHLRPEHVREDVAGWAKTLDERVRGRGLEIADVFVIPWSDFETMAPNHPDPHERDEAAALFRDMLELTSRLEAPGMTMLPGIDWEGESHDDSLQRAAEELAWRSQEAHKRGVRFSIEPHVGSVCPTPAEARRLCELAPELALTLDYTHFVFQGLPETDGDQLVPHARHVHARAAREGRLQTTLRDNGIDWERIVDLLLESGYDGYFAIEYVWTPADPPGGPYDLTNTDNVAETVLLRELVRKRLATRTATGVQA
jgi:sugar phosphate isomerase/epimerase